MTARRRVEKAKAEADLIAERLRLVDLKKAELKSDLSRTIDEMEAAVQAHDIATRNHQAAQAALLAAE